MKKSPLFLLLIVIIFSQFSLKAQNNLPAPTKADSLRQNITELRSRYAQLSQNELWKLAENEYIYGVELYYSDQKDSAFVHFNQCVSVSEQLDTFMNAKLIVGRFYYLDNQYEKALTLLESHKERCIAKHRDTTEGYWNTLYFTLLSYSNLEEYLKITDESMVEFENLSRMLGKTETSEYYLYLLIKCKVLFHTGKVKESELLLANDIAKLRKKFEVDSPENSLKNLLLNIDFLLSSNKYDQVPALIDSCYTILATQNSIFAQETDSTKFICGLHYYEAQLLSQQNPAQALALLLDNYDLCHDVATTDYDNTIANCYSKMGNFDAEIVYRNRNVAKYEQAGDTLSVNYFINLLNLATAYLQKDNAYEALAVIDYILSAAYLQKDNAYEALAVIDYILSASERQYGKLCTPYLSALGQKKSFYTKINNFPAAFACQKEIAALKAELYGVYSEEYAIELHKLAGDTLQNNGSVATYMEILWQSYTILDSIGSLERYRPCYELYRTFSYLGEIEQANFYGDLLITCLKQREAAGFDITNIYDKLVLFQAFIAEKNKDYSTAKGFYTELLQSLEQQGRKESIIYLQTLSEYAHLCFLDNSQTEELIPLFYEAFRDQYVDNFSKYNQDERDDLLSNEWFTSMKDVLFSARQTTQYDSLLCDFLILSKGLLLTTMNSYAQAVANSNDEAIFAKYADFCELQRYILGESSTCTQASSKEEAFRKSSLIERELTLALTQKGLLKNELKINSLDVQTALQPDELAIEFVNYTDLNDTTGQTEYYAAMLLSPQLATPVFKKICKTPQLYSLALKPAHDFVYTDNTLSNSSKLYKLIWQPFEDEMVNAKNIYFSASGLMHKIALEQLWDGQQRMSTKKNMVRLSSTRELCLTHPALQVDTVVLFGGIQYGENPNQKAWNFLPGTMSEITAISKQMQRKKVNTRLYSGEEGTEISFKNLSHQRISILHIATHGFYRSENEAKNINFYEQFSTDDATPISPMHRSGMILANGNQAWMGDKRNLRYDDGILTSYEIAALDLNACDLVVLTGLGDNVASEGIFGLQRAFKQAGVNTLIMSLWTVDDASTALLMQTFYHHLLRGKSKRMAFNTAIEAVKEKFSKPENWAAFIMLD